MRDGAEHGKSLVSLNSDWLVDKAYANVATSPLAAIKRAHEHYDAHLP